MRFRRALLLAIPLASSGLLLECVGDAPVATPPVAEAGADTTPPVDSGNDAVADTGNPDAPPPCIIPDSGAPGSLDPAFSNAVNTFTNAFAPTDITIDPQGRVYITGKATNCATSGSGLDMAVVRLTASGAIDLAFNPGNKPVCVSFDAVDEGYAVRIDPDGNIVVAGIAGNTGKFYAGVTRLTPAGALDTSFGTGGKLDVLGAGIGVPLATGAGFVVAFDVAFDPATKKIWLVGGDDNGNGGPTKGYIAHLNANGTADLSFNSGAVLADPSVDAFWAAADDGAGGVYAAGQTHSAPRRMVVKHFGASGAVDPSFGTNGSTTVPTADASTGDRARSLLRLADGRLVVAGSSYGDPTGAYGVTSGPVAVARLLANGAPDPAFGGGKLIASPKLVFDPFFMTHMLGQLCDGTVLLAGRLDVAVGNQDLALTKLDPSGAPQLPFGTAGVASLSVAGNQSPVGAAQDPITGKIVVIGGTQTPGQVVGVRFNP